VLRAELIGGTWLVGRANAHRRPCATIAHAAPQTPVAQRLRFALHLGDASAPIYGSRDAKALDPQDRRYRREQCERRELVRKGSTILPGGIGVPRRLQQFEKRRIEPLRRLVGHPVARALDQAHVELGVMAAEDVEPCLE